MTNKTTLIEIFGGPSGIHEMVSGFHQRLVRDVKLRRYFRHQDVDAFVVLHQEFFEIALGRNTPTDSKIMKQVQESFPLEQKEFPIFIGHIIDTLELNGLDKDDKQDVIARIAAYIESLTGLPCNDTVYTDSNSSPQSTSNHEENGL